MSENNVEGESDNTMGESMADLLLHPIRMRILQALVATPRMTAQQIADVLGDVPPATLYRQLGKLVAGGILAVVEQRQVRGASEKIYTFVGPPTLGPDDLAAASKEEHMRYFTAFVSHLLGQFERYLRQDSIDLAADGVVYRQGSLYLSDAELTELGRRLGEALAPFIQLPPSPERRLRSLTTILIPEPKLDTHP